MSNEEKPGNRERNGPRELDAFKREIDLRQLALGLGYEVDRRESWRGSTVLRSGADKIVVKRNTNGHYVFFSVRDEHDHGTVIDFLQRRRNLNLGAVRRILRPWIGRPSVSPPLPELQPTRTDPMRVDREYRLMADALRHPYLENERCLPASVLVSARFAGRVRIDRRGNAVFPHFDVGGLCGYEIKNHGFTGFAAGGKKGLWFSHSQPGDRRLVLAESAIDALSHAVLFPDLEDRTRYGSLGGKPNTQQPKLIQLTIARLPDAAEVVAAFDADAAGRTLVEMLCQATAKTERKLEFLVHLPPQEGDDWNDVLQNVTASKTSHSQRGGESQIYRESDVTGLGGPW